LPPSPGGADLVVDHTNGVARRTAVSLMEARAPPPGTAILGGSGGGQKARAYGLHWLRVLVWFECI